MATTNSAAWLRSEKANLTVEPSPYPTAGSHQVVVRNRAIGLIPVESKQQKLGIFPLAYPNVILGTSVSPFKLCIPKFLKLTGSLER